MSITDNDLYKFTMQQAVLELYPDAIAEYDFTSRKDVVVNQHFVSELRKNVEKLGERHNRLGTSDQRDLEKIRFLKPSYVGYINDYRYNPDAVTIAAPDAESFSLKDVKIKAKGYWHKEILWEVPILYSVSDAYYRTCDTDWNLDGQAEKIIQKGKALLAAGCRFADFGTRRRRSYATQQLVVENLNNISRNMDQFIGTSNVELALAYNVKPIGTMAHEWIMGVSGLESLRYANRFALHGWNKVYKGDLGVALTDTFGTEAFFEDFDKELARLFDGVRHDSGNPFEFANKVVAHYKKLGINPNQKAITFSDGLDVETAIKLQQHCNQIGILCNFGIGTNFTNDFISPALNIVMKLRTIAKNKNSKAINVVKISDVSTKATGEETALRIALNTFLGTPL